MESFQSFRHSSSWDSELGSPEPIRLFEKIVASGPFTDHGPYTEGPHIHVAGDHGGFIHDKCGFRIKARLKTREEILDGQGAFLAIKWGKDYGGKFDKDIKSSANLFRYIFSHLAQDDSILLTRVPDNAY